MNPIKNSATVQCPKGTFEDGPMIELIHQQRVGEITRGEFLYRYENLIKERRDENPSNPWGFKNTVFQFEPALFLRCFEKRELRFAMTFRNPVDCARSLMVNYRYFHDNTPPFEQTLPNVCESMQRLGNMLNRYRDIKTEVTTYEEIKRDPITVARRFAAFLGLTCENGKLEKIDKLILRNHTTLKGSNNA